MKVSIKHLSITFMGNEETKTSDAPKEFYSPYERELRTEVEALIAARDNVSKQNDILRDLLAQHKKQSACLQSQLGRSEAHSKALLAELDLIVEWTKEYDEGKWPDHNAKGTGRVSKEVLHMMRDVWADLESRPVPKPLEPGVSLVECREHGPNVTQYGDCLYVAFSEVTGRPLGAWHSLDDATVRAEKFNRQNAPAPVQPVEPCDHVGVGQPAPETPDTQPAEPEPAPAQAASAYIDATAKKCPGFHCTNLLTIGQKYCGRKDCERTQQVIAQVAMQAEPATVEESKRCEPDPMYSVCQHEDCNEPQYMKGVYCRHHSKASNRT